MTLYGQHQYFLKKKQIIYGCETNSLYYILDLFDKIGFFNIDRIAIDSFDNKSITIDRICQEVRRFCNKKKAPSQVESAFLLAMRLSTTAAWSYGSEVYLSVIVAALQQFFHFFLRRLTGI